MGIIQQNKQLTLAEVNKMAGFQDLGDIIAELSQNNEFLDEVPWFPSTHGSHNEDFKAKNLGKGAFTRANTGIPSFSSQGDIIKEPVRLYEGESVVDERLLEGADDPYRVRENYDKMQLEGILQDFNSQLIYSKNFANPDAFNGFAQRRNKTGIKVFCRDAGGTGAGLTSAWLMELGRNGVYLSYNKAGTPGLKNEDRGKWRVPAPDNTGMMWAWIRHYEVWGAINVHNERALQRLANIEADDTSINLDLKVIIQMRNQLPNKSGSSAVLFANRTVASQIEQACSEKANISYSLVNIEGYGPIPRIYGVYVRPWEAISENESQVAAA
jgi:hypothetical protein